MRGRAGLKFCFSQHVRRVTVHYSIFFRTDFSSVQRSSRPMRQTTHLVFLVLYTCVVIQVVPVELECRTGYFESHPGYKLRGHVIRKMSAVSIWSCILECRRSLMCFSLNVDTDEKAMVQCELSKSTRKASPKDYIHVTSSRQIKYLDLIPNIKDHFSQPLTSCSLDKEALPDGWYRYQSSIYKYFNEKLTNDIARERCSNLSVGADLVSLESESEMNFVNSLVMVESKSNVSTSANEGEIWIGLNDKTNEGTYAWYDGKPLRYTNWAKNEPNNRNLNEDCAISFANGKWNDVSCNSKYKYVCKASVSR